MMSSDSELFGARLARMQALVDDLEFACAAHMNEPGKFLMLKAELEHARYALESFQTHARPSDLARSFTFPS